jgi:membrane-associated protease RseP (regulator of RpoE activity)
MCSLIMGVEVLNNILITLTVIITAWAILNIAYSMKRDYFESKGFKLYYGLVLVYRRRKNIKEYSFVRKASYVSIALFIISLIMFYYSMILGILAHLGYVSQVLQPKLLIPGINILGDDILFFIIAVVLSAIIHEYSHAYMARSHNVPVKNLGFAILFFIPVAFTEIDEEKMRNVSVRVKASILSAGPASNLVLGIIFLLLLGVIISPYGILIKEVTSIGNTPSLAQRYGLGKYMIIEYINDTPATLDVLKKYMEINNTVYVKLTVLRPDNKITNIIVKKPANTSKLGIFAFIAPREELVNSIGVIGSYILLETVFWLMLVNLGLAIINAAPIFVSDGGRIIYEALGVRAGNIINTISIIILIIALIPAS